MKTLIISLTILSMFFYGCKNQAKTDSHNHEGETTEAHAGHDHGDEHKHAEGEEHKHEGETAEEHAAHGHEGHKHAEGEEHKHETEAEGHDHDHETEDAKANSDEIIFTKAQAAKTEFEVQEIQPGNFNQVIKTTGQIMPAPGDESVVVATSNGIVSFSNKNLAEGAAIRQGQPFFNIISKNIAEGDHYSKVSATYQKAKAEFERAEKLVKNKIISQKEFEAIQLDYQNAKIAYDAVSGSKTAQGVGVSAPMNGYIKNILVKDGEYVTVGQALATVSQNKRLVLRAEVSEKYYKALGSIASANFKTPYDNQVYALSDLKGKLLSFGKSANSNSFFVPVSFEFDK